MGVLRIIGNILWFIFCGFWLGLGWLFFGLLWCITIIGIPVGLQCFKLSGMGFLPFGKEIERENISNPLNILLNILWFIFGGLWLSLGYFTAGILCCVTIAGIPFGVQCFKLTALAFMPFGAKVLAKK
ncbi:MAG: YccF domain-containing protein [Chitinispirillales bacterium]|jgi:uncharacterized membrane protein YccF (DUF307 family)|nr:YccF domain-containing protein [Chitinispirillales bacterium]